MHTFTEREKLYNLFEALTGRAVHHDLHAHRRRFA
jgi:NADH:ubiquinone oxidoreductase subunit D